MLEYKKGSEMDKKNKITLDIMKKMNSSSHRKKRIYEQPIVDEICHEENETAQEKVKKEAKTEYEIKREKFREDKRKEKEKREEKKLLMQIGFMMFFSIISTCIFCIVLDAIIRGL